VLAPLSLLEQRAEAGAHVLSLVRKTGQRYGPAADASDERAWTIEYVNAGVRREACVRQSRALVIARDDEDGHTAIRDTAQRLVRLVRQRLRDRRPIEHVASVDDEIDFSGQRRLERRRVVRKKVVAATPPRASRADREIETQVGVGEQQDADIVGHPTMV